MKTQKQELILWGFNPKYNYTPIKLCAHTNKAQRDRESEGWICGCYAKGDEPKGLRLEAANMEASSR